MQNNSIENRQIRIFISSTFRDMMPERDYLINKTFPILKKYCYERGIILYELDLRWGISEEDSKQGKVVDVCLREIDDTRPFFIGLLGERYGWIPKKHELGSQVFENYTWIKYDLTNELSITEIEIQYGVLRSSHNINASFYFRSQGMTIPNDFREKPGSIEAQKLSQLKKKINTQTKYPVQEYTSIEDLGNRVEADFKALVDRIFPQKVLSELDQERLKHRVFLKNRTEMYIATQDNYDVLNNFSQSNMQEFVIVGKSGIGKSALIANWIEKYASKLPSKLIYHFIGNSNVEGNYLKITQRLIDEIIILYNLTDTNYRHKTFDNKDSESEQLKKELTRLINQISENEPLLIILDGMNQLADIDNAKQINWLPSFPKNIKVIYSTVDHDTTMDTFKRRKYGFYTLQPLKYSQREEFIFNYLKLFGKSLLPEQIRTIASNQKMENTLVLRTLLDELRVFGMYEQIDEQITYYLDSNDIPDFFDLVLKRLETVYNFSENNFVRDVFSLLAISRVGLSESEILNITGVAPLYWSQLYVAISSHLISKNGLITFSHHFLSDAVWKRYLFDKDTVNNYRKKIVSYCEKQDRIFRIYDELPYQLYELQALDKLYGFLLNIDVFDYIYKRNIYELIKYWKKLLEDNEKRYSFKAYLEKSDDSDIGRFYNNVGYFVGHYFADNTLALEFHKKALIWQEKQFGLYDHNTAVAFNNIGIAYRNLGNLEKASEYFQKAMSIRATNTEGYSVLSNSQSLFNSATVHYEKEEFEQAEKKYNEALHMFKILNSENPEKYLQEIISCSGALASVYKSTNQNEKAEKEYEELLTILRNAVQNHPDIYEKELALTLYNCANFHDKIGKNEQALKEYVEAAKTFRRLKSNDESIHHILDLAKMLTNLAGAYLGKKHYDLAGKMYLEVLEIYNNLSKNSSQYTSKICMAQTNLAIALYKEAKSIQKDDLAEAKFLKALELLRDSVEKEPGKYLSYYANVIWAHANYYSRIDCFKSACDEYERALEIFRMIDKNGKYSFDISSILFGLAYVHSNAKQYEKAESEYAEALQIKIAMLEVKHPDANLADIANTFYNLGYLHQELQNFEAAENEYGQSLEIYRNLSSKSPTTYLPDVAGTLNNLGNLHYTFNNHVTAEKYYKEALDIYKNLSIKYPDTYSSDVVMVNNNLANLNK